MSKKKKDDKKEPVEKSRHIQLQEEKGKSRDRLIAELATSGLATNGTLLTKFADNFGELSLTDCIETLKSRADTVIGGNMAELERILTAQAVALDTIFCSMAQRAQVNVGHYPDTVSKYMNLALRAQSQCRATAEALAEIKNPRPYIQNNKGQYVQVNNGERQQQNPLAHAEEKPKSTNELLEDKTHEQEWLDAGAPETAGGNDKELEAVGAKHGAEDK